MKDKYVVINEYGGRIHINPERPGELAAHGIVFKNPDTRTVDRISPAYWKAEGGRIVAMSEAERRCARAQIQSRDRRAGRRLTRVQVRANQFLAAVFIGVFLYLAWPVILKFMESFR